MSAIEETGLECAKKNNQITENGKITTERGKYDDMHPLISYSLLFLPIESNELPVKHNSKYRSKSNIAT
jgi:hypothetical protein